MQENKQCSCCKKILSLDSFFPNKAQAGGYQSYCKDCNRETAKDWYRNSNKEKTKIASRRTMLKSKYGISIEEYQEILEKQNGVCAICGLAETVISNKKGGVDSLRVDHCHKTGTVRGLLCSKCNFGIGNFNDSMYLLTSATNYLLDFKQKLLKINEQERNDKTK